MRADALRARKRVASGEVWGVNPAF
jgi:hypothetical protein